MPLTKSSLYDPRTGQFVYGKPGELAIMDAQLQQSNVQPSIAQLPNQIPETSLSINRDYGANAGTYVENPDAQMQGPTFTASATQAPAPILNSRIPFARAVNPMGGNLTNPALTKWGKLLGFASDVMQGAAAGREASEQAIMESGGHRGGGFGQGWAAASQLPFRRGMMQQQYQAGAMQNQLLQNRVATAPMMQQLGMQKTLADIRKSQIVTPRNGGAYDTATGQYLPGTQPQVKPDDVQHLLAEAAQDAVQRGVDPNTDRTVQAYQQVLAGMKPDTRIPVDQQELSDWLKRNPGKGASDFLLWKMRNSPAMIRETGSEADIESAARALIQPGNLTALKDIASYRGDQRLKIFSRAKQLDPTFDTGLINQRIRFLGQYEDPKGRAAINRQSINNILQHAGDLLDLNNQYRRSDVRVINTPLNLIARQFGDQAYTQFQTVNGVLKDELSLYFAGGYAPSTDQQKMWNKIQSDEATPAQTEAFAREVGRLGLRRAATFDSQFRTNMGYSDPNMLIPEAVNAAQTLGLSNEVKRFGSGGMLRGGQPAGFPQSGMQPIYATNPQTKQRIVSTDGGQTWQTAK